MKILVLTPTFLPMIGGAEILILEVYRRLAARHEIRLVTAHKSDDTSDRDHLINFPVIRYKDRITPMRLRGHRLTAGIVPPFSLSAVRAVQRVVTDFGPDVLNTHYMVHTGLATVVAQKRLGVPSVMTFLGRDVPGPRTPKLWKYYGRWVANRVTEVTYITDYCRRAIFGGGREPRGRVIRPGVDLDRFHPDIDGTEIRERLGVPSDVPVLFAVQRLSSEKRVDVLIRSMPHILQRHPRTILFVGGTGDTRTKLESIVSRLGLRDSVRFTGYINDAELPGYYAMADVFVFHSRYETFGIVLAEAMAAGRPIVSVNSTAIPEVVTDGTTGILVPPSNPEAFAEKVVYLLDNASERSRLGRSARAWAERNLEWDTVAKRYESVLKTAARSG